MGGRSISLSTTYSIHIKIFVKNPYSFSFLLKFSSKISGPPLRQLQHPHQRHRDPLLPPHHIYALFCSHLDLNKHKLAYLEHFRDKTPLSSYIQVFFDQKFSVNSTRILHPPKDDKRCYLGLCESDKETRPVTILTIFG